MITQRDAAKNLKVSPQHLNAVLRGRTRPSLQLALGIERVLGVPKEELLPELKEQEVQAPLWE